jgi:lipoprotein NlpI
MHQTLVRSRLIGLWVALVVAALAPAHAAEPVSEWAAAIAQATEAVVAAPDDPRGYARRAALYAAAENHPAAIADLDRLIELEPRRAEAYDQRGSQHFMLGHIDQSIEDFDRYLKLRPDQQPWHWKRGISYYYAGRWDDGRRQFEGYQTVDDNDVENAVWRYLCMARDVGVEKARTALLPIKRDGRVPMMEVYTLYGGRAKVDDVLKAAAAPAANPAVQNAQQFYAHLYLGLYYEVQGDTARAKEQIALACKHKIPHYMGNVAEVHAMKRP